MANLAPETRSKKMPQERLTMRKIREILRLKWECQLSERAIARSCSTSRSTVADYVRRAEAAGLKWPLPENQSDHQLSELLYPKTQRTHPESRRFAGLGENPPGTAEKGGHAAFVVDGISGKVSPRVRLQPVLPALPELGREDQTPPCAWSIKPVKRCLWITPDRPIR